MKKTKKQIKAFILKTLLPYKEDIKNCSMSNMYGCAYLSTTGQKCAVGRWMKKGEWQNYEDYADGLFRQFNKKEFLLKPALEMDFSVRQWKAMQKYHDNIALDRHKLSGIKSDVSRLENLFGVKLNELIIVNHED